MAGLVDGFGVVAGLLAAAFFFALAIVAAFLLGRMLAPVE
jgi:hypothetical protein